MADISARVSASFGGGLSVPAAPRPPAPPRPPGGAAPRPRPAAPKNTIIEPAVSWLFKVTIEAHRELGLWNSFEGLGWEITMEQREEGGNNFFVHQLPGRLKYPNVKLSRPLNADSSKVAEWFISMAKGVKRTTAQIVALGGDGKEICSWGLDGVVPVRWTGPSFNAETVKVANETLELAFHGFLDPAKKGA